jgi:LPXTG-motif cell wall-anchored protein
VTLNAATIRGVHRFRVVVQALLWTASHVLYFVALLLIGIAWLVWRRRKRKQRPRAELAAASV